MTKPSSILITKQHALDGFNEHERAVIRRFLFECFVGLDDLMNRRWRRMWSRWIKSEVGEVFHVENVVDRSGPYHRMHRKFLETLLQSQDRYVHIESLHDWLKVGAYWIEWAPGRSDKPIALPKSTAFSQCSDDEMKEAHTAMVDYLHTPRAQRFLWRHLTPNKRAEMLESVLQRKQLEERNEA